MNFDSWVHFFVLDANGDRQKNWFGLDLWMMGIKKEHTSVGVQRCLKQSNIVIWLYMIYDICIYIKHSKIEKYNSSKL